MVLVGCRAGSQLATRAVVGSGDDDGEKAR
jgi:hypothetical protein